MEVMQYGNWIREMHLSNTSSVDIADAALRLPIADSVGQEIIDSIVGRVAEYLSIRFDMIYVVGSVRYGFSLRDRSEFSSKFSDLDLAVVDQAIYAECCREGAARGHGPRFPETELPMERRQDFLKFIRNLSIRFSESFAYISVAVFASRADLVRAQASRIANYVGVRANESERPVASFSRPSIRPELEAQLQTGIATGMGIFTSSVSQSTPSNSSPYLLDFAALSSSFGKTSRRAKLLADFRDALSCLASVVEVRCCLLGGSFVELRAEAPKDLDAVVFYSSLPNPSYDLGLALQRLTRKFSLMNIDMRFVPCDCEPWILVKLSSFFTNLYASSRDGDGGRGCVLLLPEFSSETR